MPISWLAWETIYIQQSNKQSQREDAHLATLASESRTLFKIVESIQAVSLSIWIVKTLP